MKTIMQLYTEKRAIGIRPDKTPKPISSFTEYSKIIEQLAKKRVEQALAGVTSRVGVIKPMSIPKGLLLAATAGAIPLGLLAGGFYLRGAARRRRDEEMARVPFEAKIRIIKTPTKQSKLAQHRYKSSVLNNKYQVDVPDNDDSGDTMAGNEPGAGPGGGTIAAAPSGAGGPSGGVGGGAAGATASGISGSAGGIAPARIGAQPVSL